ncbi:MAG: GDP-L-fucose synthase [Gammaproteobacteria bacterium]|nr:GDP-L-fucose synthase [Gammaproteobacteria bacterium]
MEKNARIYVSGHRGLVGSAIVRHLNAQGYHNIITRSSKELDLRNQQAVTDFYAKEKPDYVIVAAAKVGGIWANDQYPAEFIYDNLMIEANVIHGAHVAGVKKLLFLGSTCIYPKMAPQPLKEDYLLTGPLEPTNEWYAVAKIAGIKMCQAYHKQYGSRFISAMPTNLYGPEDNFDLNNSHVLPALIRKFHEAKINGDAHVVVWGSGTPMREFCYVDDLAEACVFLLNNYEQPEIVNIGVGEDIRIADLAKLVKKVVGFNGEIVQDTSKPDGTPRKLVDVSRIFSLGWRPKVGLEEGIGRAYRWYLQQ